MFSKQDTRESFIFSFSLFHQKSKYGYRIYSIDRPGRLLNFFNLDGGRLFQVCAYSRQVAYSIFLLFSSFSASLVCLFCEKTINGKNKTRRCNKDSRFCKLLWRKLRLRGSLLLVLIQFQWVVGGRGWALINFSAFRMGAYSNKYGIYTKTSYIS